MFNQCNFIGRLGQEPTFRHTPSGVPVANFSIATSEKFKDQSGQIQERTEWIDVVAWKQLAEICAKYLEKGKLVFISGKFQTRKWQDKSGQDRYSTEIVAQTMKMLDSPGQQNTGAGQNAGQSQQQNNAQAPGNTGGYHGQNTSHGYASNPGQPQQAGPSGYGQQSGPAGYGQPQNNAQPGGAPEPPPFDPDAEIPF